MNDLRDSETQTDSPETLVELNPQELLQQIHAAETAIFLRLQEMRISSVDLVEGQAIQDALDGLMRLTKETLEFADSSDSRRRQSLGLDQTDDRTYLEFDEPCLPQVSSVSIPTKFLDIVFSDQHGFHLNPPVYWQPEQPFRCLVVA
jgi:hypothetical protein